MGRKRRRRRSVSGGRAGTGRTAGAERSRAREIGGESTPTLARGDTIAWGRDLEWAVGFTADSAPQGDTVHDLRRGREEVKSSEAPWARARRALREGLGAVTRGSADIDVEYVERCGRGWSRDAFSAHIDVDPDPDNWSGGHVALVAKRGAGAGYPSRVRREARVLDWVWSRISASSSWRGSSSRSAIRAPRGRENTSSCSLDSCAGDRPGIDVWSINHRDGHSRLRLPSSRRIPGVGSLRRASQSPGRGSMVTAS